MKKRVLSAVLALVMLTTMLPVQALAAELDSAARTDSAPRTETAASASVEFVPVEEPEDEPADEPVDEAPQVPVASANVAASASNAAAQADTTSGDFTYTTATDSSGATVATITGYTGSAAEITIPSEINGTTVMAIGQDAFKGCTSLSSVAMPSVTTICGAAFNGCTSLSSVTMPSVTTIGNNAFSCCTSLKDVTLPSTLKTIGGDAFSGCTALSSIVLPEGLETLENSAFSGTAIKEITFPKSLTTAYAVGTGCLDGSNVEKVTLAEGATSVLKYMCKDAKKLTTVVLPSTVTSIGNRAFCGCTSLTTINLPNTITSIDDQAFDACSSLTSLDLPEGVTSIGSYAFWNCTKLTNIGLPSTLKTISLGAFSGCTALSSIVLPDGLETLRESVFSGTAIKEITFPNSLTTAYNGRGTGCLDGSNVEKVTLAEGTTSVLKYMCRDAKKLTTVVLPSTVTSIEEAAFRGCALLTTINLPEGLTSIGYYSFEGCKALAGVTLPSTLKTIDSYAFSSCTTLTEIELPEGLTTLHGAVFSGTAIKEITFPKSLTMAYNGSATGCLDGSNVEKVTLAEGMTSVPEYMFRKASKLTTVNLPDTITSIGDQAFDACSSLTSLDLPEGVTSIGRYAFWNCTKLTNIDLPSTLKTIGNSAFSGCKALESIVLPESVTSIGSNVFSGCTSLTLYTVLNSYGTIYAIDNDMSFVADDSTPLSSNILNRSKTRYYFDTGSINTNGCLPFTVVVSIPEETFTTLTNPKVTIRIPTGATLQEDSIKVNDTVSTNYTYSNSNLRLTIPLTAAETTIRFYTKVSDASKLASYAKLTANSVDELIGVVNEPAVGLSIVGPERTSSTSVTLSGIAPVGAEIALTRDGGRIGTVIANKAGTWSCAATLPKTEGAALYTFAASCTAGGTFYSADCQVYYEQSTPTVTEFTLQVEGHGMQTIDLLENAKNNTTPKVGYYLTCPEYRFDITFANGNPDSLDNVYVTSTKNGVRKVMEAIYDKSVGHYVAEGYFDDANHSYMPGNIRVEYNLKTETQKVDKNFNVNQYQDNKVKATPTSTSENETTGTIDLSGLGAELGKLELEYALKLHDNYTGTKFSDLYDQADEAIGWYKYIIPGEDGKNYFAALDYTDPTTYTMFIGEGLDIADKVYSFKISAAEFGTTEYVQLFDAAEKISQYSTVVGLVGKTLNIISDTNELRDDIQRSSMDYGDKLKALKKTDELQSDRIMYVLMAAALPAIVASGGVMAGPAIVFSGIVGIMGLAAGEIWKLRMAQIKGDACSVDWYMDPSGYVLDADTGKPVVNAKMTAYYIPLDDKDNDFYTNKPTDYTSEKIKMWDAKEYGQENPINTDSNGWYRWDVPEGWWYVVCEKDGYEVTCSGWVPVAPPQTEVNFDLERIYSLGDVNGDNNTNALDMQCLYEYLTAGTYNGNATVKTWDDWQTLMLDINYDGSIDVYDLQRLYERISYEQTT